MADEQVVVKDPVVASTSTTTQADPVTTPAGEQPATKTTEKEVPYDRFQEVIKQKNEEKLLRQQYEAKIKELETRLPNGQAAPDRAVQRLVAGGMKQDAAQLIADTMREEQRAAMAPIQERENARSIEQWRKEIERSDPDYKKLKPQLAKAFDELSNEDKQLAISSPKGLEWFYKSVKSEALAQDVAKAHEAGVKQGYENKGLKEGMSSTPKSGTALETPITFESIRAGAIKKMSDAEYMKRKPEIDAIVAKGPTQK